MRRISLLKIKEALTELVRRANFFLREDVLSALCKAYAAEKNKRSRIILKAILDNATVARKEKLAICQDTGFPVVFVQVGRNVIISGYF